MFYLRPPMVSLVRYSCARGGSFICVSRARRSGMGSGRCDRLLAWGGRFTVCAAGSGIVAGCCSLVVSFGGRRDYRERILRATGIAVCSRAHIRERFTVSNGIQEAVGVGRTRGGLVPTACSEARPDGLSRRLYCSFTPRAPFETHVREPKSSMISAHCNSF